MTSPQSRDDATWVEILDALERALEDGEAFDPPTDPPPMPPRLIERARSIMERQTSAAARIEAEMDELSRELDRNPRPPRRDSAPALGAALSL